MTREGGPKGPQPEEVQPEAVKKDRKVAARLDVKTGSYDVDFNSPESVEAYLDQIIEQKVFESGRKIKSETKDRWKRYFHKSVDRALRTLQTTATQEERKISESEQREAKIEKIGSFKNNIEQALKRLNPDMPNKEELKGMFVETALKLKEGEKIAVLAIDLDNFKILNDRKGHFVGNEVLQSFGGALGESVEESLVDSFQDASRPDDIGAHFSGDEFGGMLIMKKDDLDGSVLERVIKNTQKKTIRPSTITGSKAGETELQEISTGYEIITYEEVQRASAEPGGLEKLFEQKLKEADSRSLFSKAVRYAYEVKGRMIKSSERVFGPDTKIELSEEEMVYAQQLHAIMRQLSEKYPEYAANSRNKLLEYASLMLDLPGIGTEGKGEKEKIELFNKSIERIRMVMEELSKKG